MTLRVGMVTSEFPPDIGGVETYAWQLATALGRRPNLSVTVYVPRKSADIDPPPGVELKPFLASCKAIDWPKLKREPIDVWHALSAGHAWLAAESDSTVVSVHGNDFLTPYPLTMRPASIPIRLRPWVWTRLRPLWHRATRKMLRQALPQAGAIVANSRYTAETFLSLFPYCAPLMKIAWVGVDHGFFSVERSYPNQIPSLLSVCRLSEPRKNIDQVIRALAGLKARHKFRYTIVGDGALRSGLEALAISLDLQDCVCFRGWVSDAELKALYARADLFVLTASVLPNSHEGFGIVYLEAAACGVPSLAARLAGAVEAISEGKSGFFVGSPEIDEIRLALDDFLTGRISFESHVCRKFASSFSWEKVADIYEYAYQRAVHHGSHQAN